MVGGAICQMVVRDPHWFGLVLMLNMGLGCQVGCGVVSIFGGSKGLGLHPLVLVESPGNIFYLEA